MTEFEIGILAVLEGLENKVRTIEAELYEARARAAHLEARTAAAEQAVAQLQADRDELFRAHNALAEAFKARTGAH